MEHLAKNTKIVKGQLMKKLKDNNLVHFAKPSDRLDIIRNAHRVTSHSAQTKTLEKIKEDCYGKALVLTLLNTPIIVCYVKKTNHLIIVLPSISTNLILLFTLLVWIWLDHSPRVLLALNIIVAINHLTKWVEARAIRDLLANTVANFFLEQIIFRHGSPNFYSWIMLQTSFLKFFPA